MKAFIAVMLIAAVSGQMTTGVDKTMNIMDLLKYRTVYPQQLQGQQYINQQFQGQYQRGLQVPTTAALYNYIQQLQQNVNGVNTDLTTGFVQPSTQQITDVFTYTLPQLYTLPLFQEYMTIPLFREFLTVPAFQKYLVNDFQKYWTQTVFKNFFVDPVLFYKYIFPVVMQYQQVGQYGYNTQYGVNQIVPSVFRQLDNQVYGRQIVPNMYNNVYNTLFNKQQVIPELFNNMNMNTNELYNTIKTVYPEIYGKYNTMNKNFYNKNILDVLTGKTELYPFGIVGQQIQTPFTTTDKTAELYLETIIKDLLKGKIDLTQLKDNINVNQMSTIFNEQVNKIVDPITGDLKIVEEKIVKPFDTVMGTVEGEQKDTLVKKILLNKAIFNKL